MIDVVVVVVVVVKQDSCEDVGLCLGGFLFRLLCYIFAEPQVNTQYNSYCSVKKQPKFHCGQGVSVI